VRWWLLREMPRGADADFTIDRLVSRVVTMIHRYRDGHIPASAPDATAVDRVIRNAAALIAGALEDFDFRRATEAVWQIADEANRARPWDLAKAGDYAELDAGLSALLFACQAISAYLVPFFPDAAARIIRQCTPDGAGLLPSPAPLLPRIAPPFAVAGGLTAGLVTTCPFRTGRRARGCLTGR
jgi:methionyl-tRNA synthetase